MNIKPYCSGDKIKSIENPIIGKLRNKMEVQIEAQAINFSITKQNRVTGRINRMNTVIRLSDKVNEPMYRFIKKHNTAKHTISFNHSTRSIFSFVIS